MKNSTENNKPPAIKKSSKAETSKDKKVLLDANKSSETNKSSTLKKLSKRTKIIISISLALILCVTLIVGSILLFSGKTNNKTNSKPNEQTPLSTPTPDPTPTIEPQYVLSEDGKYITFGEFPQTIKSADVTITSSLPDSDGYYLGSDGERYAKLTFTYEENIMGLNWNNWVAYEHNLMSDGTTLEKDNDYYFKVEPIKWRVLQNSDGTALIVTDQVLQSIEYQSSYEKGKEGKKTVSYALDSDGNRIYDNDRAVYATNYKWSSLRSFLTGDFYTKAFSSDQKSIIQLTTVDNSVTTTQNSGNEYLYVCEDTQDYVFALSWADVTNSQYGFQSESNVRDTARRWGASDYAIATKVFVWTQEYLINVSYSGTPDPMTSPSHYLDYITRSDCAMVWLRSPTYSSNYCAGFDSIIFSTSAIPNTSYYGVAPALYINL